MRTPLSRLPRRLLSSTAVRMETFTVQDDEDFTKRVLESSTPTIVDFSAGWCGPCKMLSPRLDAAVAATAGKVNLASVDIDEMSDLALYHDVQAVPTVLGMKDGKVVDKFVGLVDEDQLEAFVQKLI